MNHAGRAFISYSWVDKALARRLARRLRHCGVDVFLDETQLGPGMPLPESLLHAIHGSSHVFVVWTAAASASEWVAKEIEFARTADTKPVIVPLLFVPPGASSIVSNTVGVDFSRPHRFELAFQQVRSALGLPPDTATGPGRETLAADLATTLRETPSIAALFGSPIERAVTAKELGDVRFAELVSPDDASSRNARDATLAKARGAFETWKPESVSVTGLPTAGEPDFHALDFSMWCAAGIALLKSDELEPLAAPEVKTHPAIFAKVLGATGGGFEAILLVLGRFPGFASDPMLELLRADQVRDAQLGTVVELYDAVFHLVARSDAPDQFMPFSCAESFLRHNLARLTAAQKQAFLRLAMINGNGPCPGGPLDMLGHLYRDADLAADVVERVLFWVEHGLFDRFDAASRSESPRLFHGFVAGLIGRGAAEADVQRLLEAAALRIRKQLRLAKTEPVLRAMRWIGDADRLPEGRRGCIERGYQEGVFSAEFEAWEHAARVSPLVRMLVDAVLHHAHDVPEVKARIRAKLIKAGLPDDLN